MDSIHKLPDKVFLDANALLNGAFVRDSQAHRAIQRLRSLNHTIFVDEATWLEAVRVAERIGEKLGIRYQPSHVLLDFTRATPILHLPPAEHTIGQHVNKSDRHVANAVAAYEGCLLSDDHQLVAELHLQGISALTTQGAAMLGGPPLAQVQPMFPHAGRQYAPPPRRITRHYFMSLLPGDWAAVRNGRGRFTGFDYEGRVWVYYDLHTLKWCANADRGPQLTVNLPAQPNIRVSVCYTYSIGTALGSSGSVALMVCNNGQGAAKSESRLSGTVFLSAPRRKLHFGNARSNQHHWNGAIGQYCHDVGLVSFDTFKYVASVPGLMPSVSTGDILRLAMPLVAPDHAGNLLVPTIYDLRGFA